MADKKEVLDYLRNQQKAAEIEAKMNGVNVWALLGAIAVVGWQLTSVLGAKLWNDYELIARTLVAAVALRWFSMLIEKSDSEREELRYSRTNFFDMDSPFLMLLESILIFLPPLALLLLAGKSIGAVILGLLGVGFIVFASISVLKPLLRESHKTERFPKPEFELTRRSDAISHLVFGTFILVAFVEQLFYFWGMQGRVSSNEAKPMMLLAVLYLLVLITVDRKRKNESIAWTYELETDIVLGAISPDVAIRRIENRRLGPRLQDVVDRFFDDLDQRFTQVDSELTDCAEKINAAKEVPAQYPAERAARVKAASDGVANRIDALAADCKEFREYLEKLEKKPGGGRVQAPVLASLKARREIYDERVLEAKLQLKKLLT